MIDDDDDDDDDDDECHRVREDTRLVALEPKWLRRVGAWAPLRHPKSGRTFLKVGSGSILVPERKCLGRWPGLGAKPMSRAAKGSAVSRNTLKKQKSSVHTPLHTSRIHPSVHVLYVCTLFMYSMYVLVVERVQGPLPFCIATRTRPYR